MTDLNTTGGGPAPAKAVDWWRAIYEGGRQFVYQWVTENVQYPAVWVLVGTDLHRELVRSVGQDWAWFLVHRDRDNPDVLRFSLPGGVAAQVLSSPQLAPWAWIVLNNTRFAGDAGGRI